VVEARNSGNTTLGPDSLVLSIGPDLLRKIPKIEAGDTLQLSTATLPSVKGATAAISGGPSLVHEKKTVYNASQAIHPRSAVGWNKDFFYFVEVDGRQPGVSIGMTYAQLATYMKNLGCDEALNLDGGGSSTLWMLGQVMNTPSEGDERGVANGLVLIQKNKTEHPTQTTLK
jgi:exopolysaccharide biosynthesis protein